MREIYMKKSVLLNQLKEAVSREEYEKLMTDTISDISQYNRRTMLEIMDSTEAPEGEVSSDQIAALKNTLKAYLGTYMADHPERLEMDHPSHASISVLSVCCRYIRRRLCIIPQSRRKILRCTSVL